MGSYLVWSLPPEPHPSSTSEEVKDKCEMCGKGNSQKTCYICDTGKFCRGLCNRRAIFVKTHSCVQDWMTERTTADDLYNDVMKNRIPRNPQVLKDYHFGNCKEPSQQEQLIRFYQILFVLFSVSTTRLHRWQKSKRIYDNSVTLFHGEGKKVPREQFFFIRDNPSMFSEDISETLTESRFI